MHPTSAPHDVHPTPDTCEVVIATGGLPATGTPDTVAVLAIGLVIVLAGAVMLLRARRARRAAVVVAAGLAGLVLIAPSAADQAAVAAPAATAGAAANTTYGGSCTLLDVGDLVIDPQMGELVPGDAAALIEGTVTNRFSGPILLTASVRWPAPTPLADVLLTDLRLAGAREAVLVAPGASVRVEFVASLPDSIDNSFQGMLAPVELVLTGVQQ